MINIAKPLTDYVIYNGRKIRLDMSFGNILRVYDVFKDDFLTEAEKAEFALALLVKNRKLPDIRVLDVIFREQIETYGKKSTNNLRVVDFRQDSAYIYSSFLMDYNIDLTEQYDKLHWQKFIALFQGLSEHTKMREVMSIRARPVPKPDKYNQEYIRNLMELKAYYALDISQEEREKNFQTGLKNMFEALKVQAERGD